MEVYRKVQANRESQTIIMDGTGSDNQKLTISFKFHDGPMSYVRACGPAPANAGQRTAVHCTLGWGRHSNTNKKRCGGFSQHE